MPAAVGVDELLQVRNQLPAKQGDALISRQPRWDSPLLWLLIIHLLGIEWSLRRLAGYG